MELPPAARDRTNIARTLFDHVGCFARARRCATASLLLLFLLVSPISAEAQTTDAGETPATRAPVDTHAKEIPISGREVPAFAAFDAAMVALMREHDVGAGVLAIARDGVVVYERGFGWSDEGRTKPLAHDALMRIASVSKPITAAAVRDLIAEGAFTLDSRAFDVGQEGDDEREAGKAGGLLKVEPFPSLGDPRIAEITVRHLLEHKGGWDRGAAGDLTYMEVAIASAMEVKSPPGRENTLRFILGKPLQFAPGEKAAYSNIGMLTLGLIVEQRRGEALETVLDGVMERAGVATEDHKIGRTFKEDQDPREPFYDAGSVGPSVFEPGTMVRGAYGTWDHEARAGQGAHIATAAALARFAAHFYVNGSKIGMERPENDGGTWRWNHTGSLAGTNSVIRQRGDGFTFAAIFNKRGENLSGKAREAVDALLDAGEAAWRGEKEMEAAEKGR